MGEKRLFEVKVLVEAESFDELGPLTTLIETSICQHAAGSHPDKCPTRWFIMTSLLEPEDAAEYEEMLNE